MFFCELLEAALVSVPGVSAKIVPVFFGYVPSVGNRPGARTLAGKASSKTSKL